jgi:hypothetical protein
MGYGGAPELCAINDIDFGSSSGLSGARPPISFLSVSISSSRSTMISSNLSIISFGFLFDSFNCSICRLSCSIWILRSSFSCLSCSSSDDAFSSAPSFWREDCEFVSRTLLRAKGRLIGRGWLWLFRSVSRSSHRRCHWFLRVHRLMHPHAHVRLVHRFARSFSHVCDWWRSHRLSAYWSARCCVLCKRVTRETNREGGSCDKALNHRNCPH